MVSTLLSLTKGIGRGTPSSGSRIPKFSFRRTGEVSSRSPARKSQNVSRSTGNNENIADKIQKFDKRLGKKSVYRTDTENIGPKLLKISQSKGPKNMLIEYLVSEDSDNVPSTSLGRTEDMSSKSLSQQSHNVSKSTGKIDEEIENDEEFDYNLENQSHPFRTEKKRRAKKVVPSKVDSLISLLQTTLKSIRSFRADSENKAPSTSVRSEVKSRSSPKKSHNVSRSTRNVREEIKNYVELDKIKQKKSVRTGSEKTSKKIRKFSKSEKPTTKLIDDSVSEYSDNVPDNDAPSTSFRNTGDRSSTSSQRKRHRRKMKSSSRKYTKSIENGEEESAEGNDTALIRTRISQPKNSRISRSLTRNGKLLEDFAGGSADEFGEVGRHSGNGNKAAIRYSDSEFDDNQISPSRYEVGASGAVKSPKRKSQAVEIDTEDPTQETELDWNESMPAPKFKKSKKKKGLPCPDFSQDIVPEPKGKKSKKKFAHIPKEPLRRSQRKRVPPLDFWRGERLRRMYVNGKYVTVLFPGRKYDDGANASLLRRFESQANKLKKLEKRKGEVPKTTVFDHHKGEKVDVNLHRPFMMSQWTEVVGEDRAKVLYYLTKTFSSRELSFGFLDICALEVKTSQYSPEDNIHFVVQKGIVKVTIRRATYEFQKYDSFIVPCSEAFTIENLGKYNALLAFCTFKVPFFPYQMVEDKDDDDE